MLLLIVELVHVSLLLEKQVVNVNGLLDQGTDTLDEGQRDVVPFVRFYGLQFRHIWHLESHR